MVIIVQVLGKYMMIGYLDPSGYVLKRRKGIPLELLRGRKDILDDYMDL